MSLLIALAATPGLLGTQEAIRQSQQKERREEHRARRCNLIANCIRSSIRCREIDGRPLVLRDGQIYVDTGTNDGSSSGHLYAGYFLPYPDQTFEGLVTTVTDVAPVMNWVYVDAQIHQLKYGVRKDADPNITGSFDCTRQDRRLTLLNWEGFCAAETWPGVWAVYFDINDDGLKGKLPHGTRVLEMELRRCEKRWKKDMNARTQDQTTARDKILAVGPQETCQEADKAVETTVNLPTCVDSESDENIVTRNTPPAQPLSSTPTTVTVGPIATMVEPPIMPEGTIPRSEAPAPRSPVNVAELIRFERPLSTLSLPASSQVSFAPSSSLMPAPKTKNILRRFSNSVNWTAPRKVPRIGRRRPNSTYESEAAPGISSGLGPSISLVISLVLSAAAALRPATSPYKASEALGKNVKIRAPAWKEV